MKRFLSSSILALLLILTSVPAFAQKTEETKILENGQQHTQFATQYGTATMTIPVQTGMTSHQVTYSAPNYSGITVTVKASANNATFSTISAPTTTGSATVTFTGTYTQIQVIYSGLTGGGPLDADYWGGTGIVVGSSGGTGTDVNIASVGGVSIGTAVPITDGAGALNVICDSGCSGGTQYTQDAALTVATSVGGMAMGRASAAAPTGVSADDDAVLPWYLRSGAQAVQLTNGGVLTLSGSGTATGALRVELANNGTGVVATVGAVTDITNAVKVIGPAADGAAVSGAPVRIAGKDGSANTQDILTNTAGNVTVAYGDGTAILPTDVVHVIADSGTITTVSTVTNVATIGTSVTPGVAAGNLGKAEDAAIASGDTGVAALFQAQATPTATAADNDYIIAKTNANGVLWTQPLSSGATAAAPPAMAAQIGGVTSGATGGLLGGVVSCDSQAFLDMTTATTTELVALTASRKVYVCYWLVEANGATTMTFKRGTGTNCGTGTTTISNAWELTTQVGFSGGTGLGAIFDNLNAGDALCVTNSAGVNLHVFVRYAKF